MKIMAIRMSMTMRMMVMTMLIVLMILYWLMALTELMVMALVMMNIKMDITIVNMCVRRSIKIYIFDVADDDFRLKPYRKGD